MKAKLNTVRQEEYVSPGMIMLSIDLETSILEESGVDSGGSTGGEGDTPVEIFPFDAFDF